MHERNLIDYISFVSGDRRIKFKCNSYGRFDVYQRDARTGRNIHLGTKGARELVDWVLAGDPVLTLRGGDKVRVGQGGSTQIRVEALCLIETHDEYYLKKLKDNRF
jgi:hypothetical protein